MATVAVLGASDNPERISHQAVQRLVQAGHEVIPVNPRGGEILGLGVEKTLQAIKAPVDTLTLYVGADRQGELLDAMVALEPRRVIFNPGSENPSAYERLRAAGIEVEEACTLVLLSTRQF